MALGERLEARAEQLEVERSLELERAGRVVGDAVVEHLAEQPQQLLGVGERRRAVDPRAARSCSGARRPSGAPSAAARAARAGQG